MNCTKIKEKMADLFDDSVSPEIKDEFFNHFRDCPDCRLLYEEMSASIKELQPRININAGMGLQNRILDKAIQTGKPYQSRSGRILPMLTPALKKVAAIAALLALGFLIIPFLNRPGWIQNKASATNTLLERSISALADVKSVYMEFNVRTSEGDNFEYIDMKAGFVGHKLWKVFGNPSKWRIEKPGRTVVMDGLNQYMYMNGPGGLALKAGADAGFVNWMQILLDPAKILQKEKDLASGSNAKYNIEDKGNTIILTVEAKALGDFRNTFALNTSVPESNNRRIYTFDKATNLLKSFEVYINSSGEEIQVIQLKTIKYNEPVDEALFTINLPSNITWLPVNDMIKNTGIKVTTSEEAAKHFFIACQKEDWETVGQLIPGFKDFPELEKAVKEQYGGLTIISIGRSFKSGRYVGEFVPYTVKCKNGYVKTFTLSLRCDNSEKKWVVDGGF